MTVLHPGVRRGLRVAQLDERDRPALTALLEADPIVNAVLAARIDAVGSLLPHRLGGVLLGAWDSDTLVGAAFSGGNLLPIGGDEVAWASLARFVARQPRICTSIVGRSETVGVIWPLLRQSWGGARSERMVQPLLVAQGRAAWPVDEEVRPATAAELDRYVPAAAAMFAEELGVSPHVAPGTAPFRARMSELIAGGRALARYDHRGQVVFKAEVGAVSRHTAQVQGVWVRPDLRGRGLGTAAMAAVLGYAAGLAPTVSLYVNEYNEPARRLYARLGFEPVATLATVLF